MKNIGRTLILSLGWPALAAVSLAMAVGRGDPDPMGIALLALATAAAYGLDRWVDHRPGEPKVFRKALLISVAICVVVGAGIALTSWWRTGICAVLGIISIAYVPLKRVIPKNLLTSISWTVGACTLPFAAPPDLHHAYWGSVICVFAIMVANTVLCDIPDVAEDRKAGVRGITPRFGAKAGATLVVLASLLGFITGVITSHVPLAITAALLGPVGVLMGRDPTRSSLRKAGDLIVTFVPGPLSFFL